MRKRQVYAVVIVALVLSFSNAPAAEPFYLGRTLSQWVEVYTVRRPTPLGFDPAATYAIRHIGTNALPYLLNWISYERPAWKSNFYAIVNSPIGKLNPSWQFNDWRPSLLARGSVQALIDLGPEAEGAIGDLSRLANGPKLGESRNRAVAALGALGRPGLRALVGVLTNQHAQNQKWTTETIAIVKHIVRNGYLDQNTARLAVPSLLKMRGDTDPEIRAEATRALEAIDPSALGQTNLISRLPWLQPAATP